MLSLGRTLVARGNRVSLVAAPDAEAQTRQAGLDYLPIGAKEFPVGSMRRLSVEMSRLSSTREVLEYTINLYRSVATILLDEAYGVIESAKIEGLIVDQASPSGSSLAEGLGLPFVSVATGAPLNREPGIPSVFDPSEYRETEAVREGYARGYAMVDFIVKSVIELINERRQHWGLPPVHGYDDLFSPSAQISQMPTELDFPRKQLPSHFHSVGPLVDLARGDEVSFPYERLDGRPLVYASLGTILGSRESVLESIANACRDLDCQLVITLGNREAIEVPTFGDAIVVPYAPQPELLSRANLIITVAGMNTTLDALSKGVPIVAIPMGGDQPGIGSRIAYHGVGRVVEAKRPEGGLAGDRQVDEFQLREAVSQVLSEDSFRTAARRIQKAIQSSGGLQQAANIVELALKTGEQASVASVI